MKNTICPFLSARDGDTQVVDTVVELNTDVRMFIGGESGPAWISNAQVYTL